MQSGTLKYEDDYLSDFETYDNVMMRLPHFIEGVYNRIHPEGRDCIRHWVTSHRRTIRNRYPGMRKPGGTEPNLLISSVQ
jgi:hypothetical protein